MMHWGTIIYNSMTFIDEDVVAIVVNLSVARSHIFIVKLFKVMMSFKWYIYWENMP